MTPSGDSAAAAAAAGGGGAGVPAGAREVCSATPTLARIKVVPNSADEEREANFPRNLHNAAELFLRAGLAECARACIGSANALFAVLKDGPDGKQSHSVGRAAICWQCGYVGLPDNATECSESSTTPAAACGSCRSSAQTNFVRVTGEGGATVPWIQRKADASSGGVAVTDAGEVVRE